MSVEKRAVIAEAAKPIRVMLVDDHRSVLWGLQRLIDSERPRMEVVGKAMSGAEALEVAAETRPDVILLDLDLGDQSGLDVLPGLISKSGAKVLVLTGLRDPAVRDNAVLAGARGIVEKEEPAETILKAVEKVHGGEMWLDRVATGRIFVELSRKSAPEETDPERRKISSLTEREHHVVAALVNHPEGSVKELADELHISEHTLRNYLASIYAKLGVPGRLALYVYAQQHGLGREKSPSG